MQSTPYAIVILSYNHPEITSQCIESVLIKNNFPSENIYLVHNGSQPNHVQTLKHRFPQITHIESEQNKGYSGGANLGLSTAFLKHNLVLFLTNDTLLEKRPNHPPEGFSSVKILKRKTNQIDSLMGRIDIKKGQLQHVKEQQLLEGKNLYIPGTAFWISADVYKKLNGFDESYLTYWEDVDFSWRAEKNQIILKHNEETVVRHKIGKTCHHNDFYTYYLFQRNRKKFMKKHNLTSLYFWIVFYYDIIRFCRYRFKFLWRIIYE